MYDAIIIGMGPAGMSAGIYAKRAGLNVLMIDESTPGGLLNKITIVEKIKITNGSISYENTDTTINDSNIAILGFGRVGKRLAKVLNGMGANIFCL